MFSRLRKSNKPTIVATVATATTLLASAVFGIWYGLSIDDKESNAFQPTFCNSTSVHEELGILAHVLYDNVTLEINAECLNGIERIQLNSQKVYYYAHHTFLPNETFDVHLHYNTSLQECTSALMVDPFLLHVDCEKVYPPGPYQLSGVLSVSMASTLHGATHIGIRDVYHEDVSLYVEGETSTYNFTHLYYEGDQYSVQFINQSHYDYCTIRQAQGRFSTRDVCDVLIECDQPCPTSPISPPLSNDSYVGGYLESNCTYVMVLLLQNGQPVGRVNQTTSSFFQFNQSISTGDYYEVVAHCPLSGTLCMVSPQGVGVVRARNITDVQVQCTVPVVPSYQLRIFHTISPKSHVYTYPVSVFLISGISSMENIALVPGQLYQSRTRFYEGERYDLFFAHPDHEAACEISQVSAAFTNRSISVWVNCPMYLMPIEILLPVQNRTGDMDGVSLSVESGNILDELVLFISSSSMFVPNMKLSHIIENNYNQTYSLYGTMNLVPSVYANRYIHFAWFDGTRYQTLTNVDNRYSLSNPNVPATPVLLDVHVSCEESRWIFNASGFTPMETSFYLYDNTIGNDNVFVTYVLLSSPEEVMDVSFTPRSYLPTTSYWMRSYTSGMDSQMSNVVVPSHSH